MKYHWWYNWLSTDLNIKRRRVLRKWTDRKRKKNAFVDCFLLSLLQFCSHDHGHGLLHCHDAGQDC